MAANEREDRILKELSVIREEIAGLRKAVEGESVEDEVTRRLGGLPNKFRFHIPCSQWMAVHHCTHVDIF